MKIKGVRFSKLKIGPEVVSLRLEIPLVGRDHAVRHEDLGMLLKYNNWVCDIDLEIKPKEAVKPESTTVTVNRDMFSPFWRGPSDDD